MNMILRQLNDALQILALPVTAQIRLDANDFGRVERLRKNFRDSYCLVRTEMNSRLSPEQIEVLEQIDTLLYGLNPGTSRKVWPEKVLRQSVSWRQVRTYARKALVKFNWPLDLPSRKHLRDHSVKDRPFLGAPAVCALPCLTIVRRKTS